MMTPYTRKWCHRKTAKSLKVHKIRLDISFLWGAQREEARILLGAYDTI